MHVSTLNLSSARRMETLLMLGTLIAVSGASVSRCHDGQYLDPDTNSCLACGTCPMNQIIRVPCSQRSNTVCGPFFEFYEFHQAPRPAHHVNDLYYLGETEGDEERGSDTDLRDYDYHDSLDDDQPDENYVSRSTSAKKNLGQRGDDSDLNNRADWKVDPDSEPSRAGEFPAHKTPTRRTPGPRFRQQNNRMPRLQTPDEEENQWKVLALALIIVLCVVCIVLIFFIFIICYQWSRRAHEKNALFSIARATSTGNERYHPSVPNYYFPVPTYAHAQSAAGRSRGVSQSIRTSPGQVEGPSVNNAAEDNQTTSNSDYVYFKSPQNGNDAVDV